MSIQGNENSFFTRYLKLVLDDSISHYYEVKNELLSITNLATNTALAAVENKIPNVSNLVKKLTITQKLMKLRRKLLIMIM